ncbi:MAG: 5,10-methylenetetrahydromethanopterin reductase [Nitrososphaerota archaeon]|nr:5,10-methylenetetrahydromethanopterin reductase [Candidatus Bathyarchaeota archaeon]MCX8162185.1 5,10-methylenetetrahydromethanopterin reductase [Candidatus Bathyarchaeota archaeon]MDW8062203.1 5,10-methylenetetrahydromethanopterin reductase [Nitrososphaerota archaeon]
MRFGVEFVPREPFWRTTLYVIEAERLGFEYVWVTDHYNNRNVFTTLTATAIYTRSIKLGVGVTNPYIRHPAATASAVASLAEIAPDRVALGIGAGDRATLEGIGIEIVKPLPAIRESVHIIRGLLAGNPVSIDGSVFKVKSASLNFKCRSYIPIYIGAQGPQMLSLAGEIGDGVLINASHPEDFRYAIEYVRKGVEKASKDIKNVDIVAYTAFSVADEEAKAMETSRQVVAFIVAGSPEAVLERHGINLELASRIRGLIVSGRFDEAFKSVTTDMIDAFSVSGSPSSVAKRIEECLKMGVTQFVVGSPIGPQPYEAMKIISSRIIPMFKAV